MEHAFEDIEVKENAVDLLEYALRHKRKRCMIGTGSMTDPYIPLEMELGNIRKALELIDKYGFGFTVITKSDRILRDLNLLQRIHEKTKCVVQITLTTYDEALCRKIEPNVSTTRERFLVLKKLQDAGIPTVVWLSPILPFINGYGGKYFRYSGSVRRCRRLWRDLLWHGADSSGREPGIFLCAAGPPFSRSKRAIHPDLREAVHDRKSP